VKLEIISQGFNHVAPLLVFKKTFKDLSQKKTNLHGEDFVAPLAVVLNDDVKHKLHFDELKSILN
jgi:hypothetical protein